MAEKEHDFVYYQNSSPSPENTRDSVRDFKEGTYLLMVTGNRDNNNQHDTYFPKSHPCLLLFERWWSSHSQGERIAHNSTYVINIYTERKVKRNPVTGYRVLTDEDIIRVRKFVEQRKRNPKSRLGINKKGTDRRRQW